MQLCSAGAIACIYLFVFVLSLPNRNLALLPVALVLLPIALASAFQGFLFWGIGLTCGLWLYNRERIAGELERNGIRLDTPDSPGIDYVTWAVLSEVEQMRFPMSIHYRLKLRDGSSRHVDLMDEEQLVIALKENEVTFRRRDWREPNSSVR
jgi:hypothetical protein